MMRRFRHKGVERFFRSGDTGGINAQHAARLRRLLTTLNRSVGPGNWRLVFEFEGDDATNVDLVDYH